MSEPLRTPWSPSLPVPLPEYPRPQMTRSNWHNLNGSWQYAITSKDDPQPGSWSGEILVPYPLESFLSGVQKALMPHQKLWYRRTIPDPRPELLKDAGADGCILLHFGAVDYLCEVWLNGIQVGSHRGGFLPFPLISLRICKQERTNWWCQSGTRPTHRCSSAASRY